MNKGGKNTNSRNKYMPNNFVLPNGKTCTTPRRCELNWRQKIPLGGVYLFNTRC